MFSLKHHSKDVTKQRADVITTFSINVNSKKQQHTKQKHELNLIESSQVRLNALLEIVRIISKDNQISCQYFEKQLLIPLNSSDSSKS